jgi:hypothetical protein
MARIFYYNDFTLSAGTPYYWGIGVEYEGQYNIDGIVQVGADADWVSVGAASGYSEGWLAIKSDGALWAVGKEYPDSNGYGTPGLYNEADTLTNLNFVVPFKKIYSPANFINEQAYIIQDTSDNFYAFGASSEPPYIGVSPSPDAEPAPLPEIPAAENPVVYISANWESFSAVYSGEGYYWCGNDYYGPPTLPVGFIKEDGPAADQIEFTDATFFGELKRLETLPNGTRLALLTNGDLYAWLSYYVGENFDVYGVREQIASNVSDFAPMTYNNSLFWIGESGHLYQYNVSWDTDESGVPFLDGGPEWLIDDSRSYDKVFVDYNALVVIARDSATKEIYKFETYGITGDPVPELIQEGLQVENVTFVGNGNEGSAILILEYEPEAAKTQFWTSLRGTYQA